MLKNTKVSTTDPIAEETRGAINHILFFLNLSNICTSKFCAIIKAVPEPIAILTDIKSKKLVEKNKVSKIPIKNLY